MSLVGVIFETKSDDDNTLVNEVNEIEDLNDFKGPLPSGNLFPNGRFDVELTETKHGNSGASNAGFMTQNMPEYEYKCERLYIDNESKLYKLLYTSSAKIMDTLINYSIIIIISLFAHFHIKWHFKKSLKRVKKYIKIKLANSCNSFYSHQLCKYNSQVY